MDSDLITWLFYGVGILLMALEVVVPGLVVVFAGAASVLVGVLRSLGLVESLPASMAIWLTASIALVFGLRRLAQRYVPSETSTGTVDENALNYGTVVEVLEAINDEDACGCVRFQGTRWKAQCVTGRLKVGEQARLVYQDGLVLMVEPAEGASDPAPDDVPQLVEDTNALSEVPGELKTSGDL